MTTSQWTYPINDITAGVWIYLRGRYPPDEAATRREALAMAVKRLSSREVHIPEVHDVLLSSVHLWMTHTQENRERQYLSPYVQTMKTARRRLDKAIEAIDDAGLGGVVEMKAVWSIRDALEVPTRPPRKPGRPWGWWTYLKKELHRLGLSRSDAREIGQLLGFAPEDT